MDLSFWYQPESHIYEISVGANQADNYTPTPISLTLVKIDNLPKIYNLFISSAWALV